MVNIDIKKLPEPIRYSDKLLLTGSCFTEHIGNSLEEMKFSVLQNPNGILFDPASVCRSLISYIQNKQYGEFSLVLSSFVLWFFVRKSNKKLKKITKKSITEFIVMSLQTNIHI